MAALLSALGSGFTAKQILNFLMRKSPQFAPKITKALSSGLSAEKVVNFLSKQNNFDKLRSEMDEEYSTKMSNANPLVQAQNTRSQNLGTDAASSLQRATPSILGGAGALAAGMALKHALPTSQLNNASPSRGANPSQTPPKPQAGLPQPPLVPQSPQQPQAALNSPPQQAQQNSPLQSPSANSLQTNLPQKDALTQPKGISNDIQSNIISAIPQKGQIDGLIKSGNGPEEIEAFYRKFNPKVIKEVESKAGKPFEEVITEYLSQSPKETVENAEVSEVVPVKEMQPSVQKLDEVQETKQPEAEPAKLEKRSFVKTPKGVGEIKEIRNGEAVVEVDNKLHKFKEDELEGSTFTEDDIADTYDRLKALTPEVEKSAFISWAGYDEDKNELGFIPKGGKYEVLKDITPEEAKAIKSKSVNARTSGETREGMWVIGEATGAGLISQIIHDRRKKNKESEAKQGKFDFGEITKPEKESRGMKPIFDENSFARGLSANRDRKAKEDERRKKKEEKERLKNEQNAEKARKKRK